MNQVYADVGAEQAFVGALFNSPQRVYCIAVNAKMNQEWFWDQNCRMVYEIVATMIQRGQTIDTVLVEAELVAKNHVNIKSLMLDIYAWMDKTIVAHSVYYMTIIKARWEERTFVVKVQEATSQINERKPLGEVISVLRHELAGIPSAIVETRNISEIFEAEEASFALARTRGFSGVPSRWLGFQEKFGGWPKGKLSIVGGRPKQGKSTLCNNDSAWSAMRGTPTAIASMEMSAGEWIVNATCAEAGLDANRFRTGKFTDEEMAKYMQFRQIFDKIPIFINDKTHTIGTLCTFIRDMATDRGCEIIVIDYLQLIKSEGKSKSRNEEVGGWSNALANLAKELPDTALIAISQLNRGMKVDFTTRKGEIAKPSKPELHHLRDSGSIEQDAYMVVFVYQDPECGMEILEDNAPTIVEVAARRGGKTGSIKLTFEKTKQRFVG